MYFRGDVAHIDGPGGHGAPSPMGFVTCLTTTAAAGSRGTGSRRRTRLASRGLLGDALVLEPGSRGVLGVLLLASADCAVQVDQVISGEGLGDVVQRFLG